MLKLYSRRERMKQIQISRNIRRIEETDAWKFG